VDPGDHQFEFKFEFSKQIELHRSHARTGMARSRVVSIATEQAPPQQISEHCYRASTATEHALLMYGELLWFPT